MPKLLGSLLLLSFLLFGGTEIWAEGSKDLYPAGAQGGRAFLRASTTSNIAFPFPTLATHYVYAEAGEQIALASSAQTGNNNRIRLYGPNNAQITLSFSSGNGRIPNRTGELAGPRLPGQTTGGNRYAPIYHTVTQSGIYRVEFIGTAGNTTGDQRMNYVAADADWSQSNNSNYLAAWDISVAKQTGSTWSWQNGRVYTNVINMDNQSVVQSGNNWVFTQNSGFYGKFKVLTRDGYVYNVDNNGNQGISFTFMVNNRGFHEPGSPDVPLYKSIPAPNEQYVRSRYHDPRSEDSGAAVTQKIFYNNPDSTMPESSIGAVPGGESWLRLEEKSLNVNEILIEGVEGSPNQLGNKGAYIKFFNESGGDYFITIRPKPNSSTNFPERNLTGSSVIGENKILWDGKDGNGNLLPQGLADVEVELKLRGAEVHFPYIDMELNHNGIILELLSEDLNSVRSDKVYWDDTDIRTVNTNIYGSMTLPRNASHEVYPNGTSSSTNGHIWGLGSNRAVGTFGDEQGMDTWTFIEGDAITEEFVVNVKIADLYTDIEYSVASTPNAASGLPGQSVNFEVTAGNDGPSDVEGAPFTFTVPVGIDITNPNNISFSTSCNNGTVTQSVALAYNENTRTFYSELDLPDGCTITYTFTGTLNGSLGIKTVESTILRPNDVNDPDATNDDINIPPTNPHYECFNDPDSGGAINCNNIQEASFMLLDNCAVEYLYYEDFGRTTWEVNSGRKRFDKVATGVASISLNQSTGMPEYLNDILQRNGEYGGATETYLFAPGQEDPGYGLANAIHSPSASVARIKNGYYTVTPPGYVQMGIPDTDSWHDDAWDPNAPTNDPDDPNSNYDWTQAWDKPNAIRDISGAINGAAFLVRGATSVSQSIKPFYEFNVNGTIQEGETFTLSMYSYVTYHDKDYMIMDVVDRNSGFIYASVPLKYPGPGLPPGASPEGFSLGWVPLEASFSFSTGDCDNNITGKDVKITIRGSQDRALDTGKGFGHTLIDDISFIKRSTGGSCDVPTSLIACEDACYEEIEGDFGTWQYGDGGSPTNPVLKEITQPGTNGGFVLDIYYLQNSFNMNINGINLYDDELEFQNGITNSPQNVRFKSDGAIWEDGVIQDIWRFYQGITFTEQNFRNYKPVLRLVIDKFGNPTLFGARVVGGDLDELEVFDPSTGNPTNLNNIHWIDDTSTPNPNTITVSQNVVGPTAMTLYGYGQDVKECEFCDLEKDGVFDDNNADGFAQAGETISYTFEVINAGDMEIHDITITDPIFGFTIKLDENTHQPTQSGITLTGDTNNNGILDRSETWTFTVKYEVTNEDIFDNKGVYNRATVTGVGKIGTSEFQISEESTDPTPYTDQDEGWDPQRPDHTFVPLKGRSLLITNPNIYNRVKRN